MKLSNLHSSSPYAITEALDPSKEEKLAYIQMMVARQGKNPDEIMSKLRGMMDPEFAKKEGYKKSLSRWVQSANPKDEKEGMAFNRRVRVTVIEAAVREMIIEGYFRGIGTMIVNKLRGILDKGRDESKYVTKFIDEYSSLAAIQRYARRSKTPIYNDERFWQLVDEVTHGKGDKIKAMMKHQFERDSSMEEKQEGLTEGVLRDPFSEITIVESKISKVMSSLGIDPEAIKNIMAQYDIRDEDYDLSRLKGGYDSAVQAVKAGASGVAGAAKGVAGGIAGAAKGVAGGVAGAAKGAAGAAGGAKAAIGSLAAGPISADKERDAKNENDDLSDYIIKTAYALMKLDEADVNTPEEASRILDQALMTGPSDETKEAGSPDIIEPSALRGIGSPSY